MHSFPQCALYFEQSRHRLSSFLLFINIASSIYNLDTPLRQTIKFFHNSRLIRWIQQKEIFKNIGDLSRGVLVLLKLYWAPDIVEFVLGRFSHFNIAIAYSNSTFCGAWTPSFCEFTENFSKTSTPQELNCLAVRHLNHYTKLISVFVLGCNWILIQAWVILSNSSNSSNWTKISSFWKKLECPRVQNYMHKRQPNSVPCDIYSYCKDSSTQRRREHECKNFRYSMWTTSQVSMRWKLCRFHTCVWSV